MAALSTVSNAWSFLLTKENATAADTHFVLSPESNQMQMFSGSRTHAGFSPWLRSAAPSFTTGSSAEVSPSGTAGRRHAMLKPLLDRALLLAMAPLLAPMALVVCGIVKLTSPGKALYSQQRIGRDGELFRIWKFRTMCENSAEVLQAHLATDAVAREEWARTQKLSKDPRITRAGRVLRSFSLDELPQVWNVLAGEMSLVGPRPISDGEIVRYGRRFDDYRRVKPGLTGIWQVSGRSRTTYEERVAMDARYVAQWSLRMDAAILLRTVRCVLTRDGAC